MKSFLFCALFLMSAQIFACDKNAKSENTANIKVATMDETLSQKAQANLEIKAEDAKNKTWYRQEKFTR